MTERRTIKVDYLARVEGEGALFVGIKGEKVEEVRLEIFEPPRFFEALLRGRSFSEAPDITARICGICPVAYQMSAVHAMEKILGIEVTGQLRALRRLLYCGEWIESHTLHMAMLHAPDFLGYEDAIGLARDHPEIVKRCLRLKKIGNEVLRTLAGREIHPINVRVGGFYRVPARRELSALEEPLRWALQAALDTLSWVGGFSFPELDYDYELVALRHPHEYPFNEGRVVSSAGLDLAAEDYEDFFEEEHVERSNALHSRIKGRGAYLVGPLARYNLNFDRLSPLARQAASDAGLGAVCRNPFRSIVVRGVELVEACREALEIVKGYRPPKQPFLQARLKAGTGCAVTEAPRGILYHRYRIDGDGTILDAKIVPPTSQNQMTIENDLRLCVEQNLSLPEDKLTELCEQAIRNYDPCISCATHFLKLNLERR